MACWGGWAEVKLLELSPVTVQSHQAPPSCPSTPKQPRTTPLAKPTHPFCREKQQRSEKQAKGRKKSQKLELEEKRDISKSGGRG